MVDELFKYGEVITDLNGQLLRATKDKNDLAGENNHLKHEIKNKQQFNDLLHAELSNANPEKNAYIVKIKSLEMKLNEMEKKKVPK